MIKLEVVGLDLAKNVFRAHGIDAFGPVRLKGRLRRDEVVDFFATLAPTLVGMEACAMAHHRARQLSVVKTAMAASITTAETFVITDGRSGARLSRRASLQVSRTSCLLAIWSPNSLRDKGSQDETSALNHDCELAMAQDQAALTKAEHIINSILDAIED